ncbi:hypothetical protein D6C85_09670 [Aureobasidium pullulans]|uniref:Amino acid permease/ SLC12A domain-containing protein n=1 Tax=Aureobasidium pullulans TaxID=5580 RepID=A0A4S9W6V6_AURPU|nr:hypothetical protein D6C85_09670 [Aureobasidium pullulans]
MEKNDEMKDFPEATISSTKDVGDVENAGARNHTKRGLSSRQVQFLALGGAIGTGLFVGSGATLSAVGPAPLLMGYIVMSFVVYGVMNVLAEMTTYLPLEGLSVPYFVNRFVDPSLAFAMGWNYWYVPHLISAQNLATYTFSFRYTFAMLLAAEVTAAAIIIQYWTEAVPVAVWIAIVLLVILALNIIAVSFFGEAEFWFASIKILAILGLIVLGVVLFFGGGPNHDRLGFRYWNEPGAFNPFIAKGNSGKFLAFWYAFIKSGFAFIMSPELVVTAAGEAEAPRRNIPKAANRFIYRLFAFYVLGTLVIGVTVSYNDPSLLSAINDGAHGAGASPFVIAIQNAGIKGLNHVINAAILTSAWSSGNAWLFSGSRMLYSLALTEQAPKIFLKCNKKGVPWVAVLFTFAIGCLAFLNVSNSGANVFNWFTNITTISGFIAWIVVLITYLRFRRAMIFHNALSSLPFRTPLQPYSAWFSLIIMVLVTLTNGFYVFVPSRWNISDFLVCYITIPIFMLLWFGHKVWSRNWKWWIAIEEVDVWSGKDIADAEEAEYEIREPRNVAEKIWFWVV